MPNEPWSAAVLDVMHADMLGLVKRQRSLTREPAGETETEQRIRLAALARVGREIESLHLLRDNGRENF